MLTFLLSFFIIWGLGKLIVIFCQAGWAVWKVIFNWIVVPVLVFAVLVTCFSYIVAIVVVAAIIIGIYAYIKNKNKGDSDMSN